MNEPNEPSYYEVALTNRQVLVSFIILLGCVLAAFVSGVYVGHQAEPLPEESVADTPAVAEPDEVAKLEEFKFFEDQEGEDQEGEDPELDKPDLSALRESKSRGETTLAQDLGASPSTVPTPRTTPAAAPPPSVPEKNRTPPEQAAPKQTPPPATPPPPATAPAKPSDADGFIIQVFSSRDEAQAKKVSTLLQSGGYQAYLSPLDQGSLIMYRVRIGPFARRDLAEKVGSDIHQKYKLETWITAAGN